MYLRIVKVYPPQIVYYVLNLYKGSNQEYHFSRFNMSIFELTLYNFNAKG